MIVDGHVCGWKTQRAPELLAMDDFTAAPVAVAEQPRRLRDFAFAQERTDTRRGNEISTFITEGIHQRYTEP